MKGEFNPNDETWTKIPEKMTKGPTMAEIMVLPPEFFDIIKVMRMGADKHGKDTWLNLDNKSMQHKNNHASMGRHLAEHYCGVKEDEESKLDPLLHVAVRALMKYTRRQRGIDE